MISAQKNPNPSARSHSIGLSTQADYQRFVEHDFYHLSNRYLHLVRACQKFNTDLESVYYVAQTGFTLLLPVIVAAVTPDDDDDIFFRKSALIARALDNTSYGDMPYAQKVAHYNAQKPLARSLHPLAYENNPSFMRLIEDYGIEFKPYPDEFSRSAIDERQKLYQKMAEIVWDPAKLAAPAQPT